MRFARMAPRIEALGWRRSRRLRRRIPLFAATRVAVAWLSAPPQPTRIASHPWAKSAPPRPRRGSWHNADPRWVSPHRDRAHHRFAGLGDHREIAGAFIHNIDVFPVRRENYSFGAAFRLFVEGAEMAPALPEPNAAYAPRDCPFQRQ
jgi:hypothetical protein